MTKAAMFWIDGIEETEAVAPADLLRRAGVELRIVSLMGAACTVVGKHGLGLACEQTLDEFDGQVDMLILPGGTIDYLEHPDFLAVLRQAYADGKRLAAICAAPAVFGKLGLLQGKKAVCYPGMESHLEGAELVEQPVVTDGNITTAKGPGVSIAFGLELIRVLLGEEQARQVARDFIVDM